MVGEWRQVFDFDPAYRPLEFFEMSKVYLPYEANTFNRIRAVRFPLAESQLVAVARNQLITKWSAGGADSAPIDDMKETIRKHFPTVPTDIICRAIDNFNNLYAPK